MASDGDEEMRNYSSPVGSLVRTPSASPTMQSRHSSHSRRAKSSKSSISMQRSSFVPQKESVYSEGAPMVVDKKEPEAPEDCNCGTDLYNRVLGHTADETILTGLQTVIDLCNQLRVCGDKEESPDEEPAREREIPERDTATTSSSKLRANKSQTEKNVSSAGFQVNPSLRTIASQTMAYPQMVSEILQTVGLTPEMASKVMQTSFQDIGPKKPSVASMIMQTSNATMQSGTMQTSNPEVKSGLVQTSSGLLPMRTSNTNQTSYAELISIRNQTSSGLLPQQKSTNNQTSAPDLRSSVIQTPSDFLPRIPPPPADADQMETASQGHMILPPSDDKIADEARGDEHKCISPPGPPSDHCKCCRCSSSYSLKRDSRESRSSDDRPPCVCGPKKVSRCRCGAPGKKPSGSVAGDQEQPQEVRYAVTKISKYKMFTIFEVMKSTRHQPKQMPKGMEGVFVLRKKNGSHDSIKSKSSRRSGQGQKSGTSKSANGAKVARNGEGEK